MSEWDGKGEKTSLIAAGVANENLRRQIDERVRGGGGELRDLEEGHW